MTPQEIKPLNKYPLRPMNEDLSRLLIVLLMAKQSQIESMENDVCAVFLYRVIVKRVEALGLRVETAVMLFIMFASSSPGDAVMFIHSLWLRAQEVGPEVEITLADFCKMYAEGFPDRASMAEAWDAQKTPDGYNLLDSMTRLQE